MAIRITENVSLAPYTTFKIGGPARFFCDIHTEEDIIEAVQFARTNKCHFFVLGGGSNILVSDTGFSGLVMRMCMVGIQSDMEISPSGIKVSVGSGQSWDEFVAWTVDKGLYGIENLSAIPGTVGAAPVQNIGAYGQEAAATVQSVRAFDTQEMKFVDLSAAQCAFDYRESIFKRQKGRYIISRVDFIFPSTGAVNIGYRDLGDYFARIGKQAPSLADVRNAVIDIRRNKLPDLNEWGTAGSYFKNPIIAHGQYALLKQTYPDAPGYPERDGRVKVPVAWILDNICNVKGYMQGAVGTYKNQALVVVTKPGATAAEVVSFTKKLMEQVERETTIKIEAEVEWVN